MLEVILNEIVENKKDEILNSTKKLVKIKSVFKESNNSSKPFGEGIHKAFEYAVKKDIPRTAHAGEGSGAESVWETLEHFKPQRIGHGVRSIEDEELIEFLVKNEIHLEVCPSCNIQTDIYKEYSDHPIDFLFKSGVSLGINTDGRSLVNVTLTDEYKKLATTFGWEAEHFYKCNVNALSHAFISNSEKEKLGQILRSNYNTNDVNRTINY